MNVAAKLILLLLLGWALAIQGEPDRAQGQKKEPVSALQSEPEPDPKERRPSSSRTFTPSEKISADSAVSFPVDI